MKTTAMVGATALCVVGMLAGCVSGDVGSGGEPETGSAAEALGSYTYSGRATVLRAQVLGIVTGVADTGPLPAAGGDLGGSLLSVNVPGLLTADAASAFTDGHGSHVSSTASVLNARLSLSVAGVNIGAYVLASTASATCSGSTPSLSGASQVVALTINGKAIVVTGAPNQVVNLLLAKIVINERSSSVNGTSGSSHAAALHITAVGLADVSISASDAGITCPPPPPAPTCSDGVRNGAETGVDCGGPTCADCADGGGCKVDGDCQSTHCQAGICVTPPPPAPTCTDGLKNAAETDVDCGGPTCSPCVNGKTCLVNGDCVSNDCQGGICVTPPPPAPTCNDGLKNGAETDVDCGGPSCAPCANGKYCDVGDDCQSDICIYELCVPAPTCTDGIKNGGETDVDCGGTTCSACVNGKTCLVNGDCQSNDCEGGICVTPPPTCTDGAKNAAETDVDCGGGTCSACVDGKTCLVNSDCQSADCEGGVCVPAPVCTPEDYTNAQGYYNTKAAGGNLGIFTLYAEIVNGAPTGHAKFDDGSEKVQSTDVTSYTVVGPHSRQIQGHCTVGGKNGTFTYVITVTDNGASGDTFAITVSDGYQSSGTVTNGSITIVADCK